MVNEGYPSCNESVNRYLPQNIKIRSHLLQLEPNHRTGIHQRVDPAPWNNRYYFLTAITEISIRALSTRAAAWMVARAGFGSGMMLL